ncbi:zinc-binding dehydrogenase [Streptomyces sp. NPDC001513]|uniref:zinc-binding dehydrogenase n=1 Tax=Streptomyces sp. NPDC001513 TaxID=3364580 RepID=UPI003685CDC2
MLVRIVGAGFCHTDMLPRTPGFMAQPPIITGHEGAGIVEEVDLHENRMSLARELGATATVHGGDDDIVAKLRGLTRGGAQYALDTTGNPGVINTAIDVLRPTGTVGLVGAPSRPLTLPPSALAQGKNVRGILEGDAVPQLFIPQLPVLLPGS